MISAILFMGAAAVKPLGLILGIIAGIILLLICVVAVLASKNNKAMDAAIDRALKKVSEKSTVTKCSCKPYENIRIYGILNFRTEQYHVENIGNLSVMKVNMGFMQMATFILTPQDKNLPLVSADYMYMFAKRKSYLEFYDLVENTQSAEYQEMLEKLSVFKASCSDLEDVPPTPAWFDSLRTVGLYKVGKTADDERIAQMLENGIGVVMDAAAELPFLSADEKAAKKQITEDYTHGLISKGGLSTDVFKKSLGEDTTKDFFDHVLFGTCQEKEGG